MVGWLFHASALAEPQAPAGPPPEGPVTTLVAEGRVEAPTWSTDGRFLAFVVRSERALELRIAEVGGGGLLATRAVSAPAGAAWEEVEPTTFGADGRLVFSARPSGADHDRLWAVSSAGGAAAELLSADDAPERVAGVAASRDGRTLVIVGRRDGWWDLFAREDGGPLRRLTFSGRQESHPFVDATGGRVIFARPVPDRGLDLYETRLSSGIVEQPVASAPGDDLRPAVGARDTVLWFHEEDGVDLRSRERVLAEGVRLPTAGPPALSPDGEWVAFTHEDRDRAGSVHLVDVAGTRGVELPTSYAGCADPALALHEGRLTLAYTALDADDRRILVLADVSGPIQRPVPYLGSAPLPATPEVAEAPFEEEEEEAGGFVDEAEEEPDAAARAAGAEAGATTRSSSGREGTTAGRDKPRRGGGAGEDPQDRRARDRSDRRRDDDDGAWFGGGGKAGAVVGFGSVVVLVGLVAAIMVSETMRRTSS